MPAAASLRILLALAIAAAPFAVLAHEPARATAAETPLEGQARQAAEVVDAFHSALAHGDGAAAAALLDDAVVIYEEGGAEQSKAAYLKEHLPADIAFLAHVREATVARSGAATPGMAWIASRGRLEGTAHDRPVRRETTETMVLKRTPAGWRIVHAHWSSRAAGPSTD